MVYGHTEGVPLSVGLDVVGHEMMHGVAQRGAHLLDPSLRPYPPARDRRTSPEHHFVSAPADELSKAAQVVALIGSAYSTAGPGA